MQEVESMLDNPSEMGDMYLARRHAAAQQEVLTALVSSCSLGTLQEAFLRLCVAGIASTGCQNAPSSVRDPA